MPSRKLISWRPTVPADTTLEVAITVMQADRHRDLELETQAGVQKWNEEDAAANAE